MKKLALALVLSVFAMLNVAFADDLSIQITREIKFANGFGQIEGKPILKNVSKDIKVMGEYNVDEKSGNVVMKIDKVLYGGKIYDLSENFSTKRRLKNVKTAVLKNKAKIKLSGGSHPELLAILNDENTSGKKADGKNGSGSSNSTASNSTNSSGTSSDSGSSSYYSRGYGSSSGSSQYPYYGYGSGSSSSGSSSSDKSSPTTDSNGNCKSPEIRDGMAYVYPLINGVCTQKAIAESNVYKKQNTSTCPNKTDYENMAVSVGEEQYAIIDDTEYRVKSCYYTDTIALSATTENCTVIPDYDNKQGAVQKQYWYILNNERVNIGSCVPTGEIIAIYDDDYNSCQYRFDFENGKAIKQTQWYYLYENKKKKLGECVDVSAEKLPKMTYPMYENAQGCECNEVSGVKLCQTKLSFNGMGNTKEDATECRYIDTDGVKLIDEFIGNYSFKDDSRQAVKKINQYFIGEGGERVYVTKDKETNKSYPYKEMSCGWEHKEDKKLSYHKTRFIIQDPELLTLSADILANNPKIQGDEYEIKGCESVVQSVIYWQQQLELAKGKKTGEHKRQVLVPEELSETAKRWNLPMIKTKNSSGVQVEAMLEKGETPIWDSNFKANGYILNSQDKRGNRPRHWESWNYKYPDKWNYYPTLKLKGGDVDNLPESITIGWTNQNILLHKGYSSQSAGIKFENWLKPNQCVKADAPFTREEVISSEPCGGDGGCGTNYIYGNVTYDKPCELWGNREVSVNNPLNAQSNLSQVYKVTLDSAYVIKPTKIDMDEHITTDNGEDSIKYKRIEENVIDPNTKKCIIYNYGEILLDEDANKVKCKPINDEEKEKDEDKQKRCVKGEDGEWYEKNPNVNQTKYQKLIEGTCQKQNILLYSTGVTFTPYYENTYEKIPNKCRQGETQAYETMEEKVYELPNASSNISDKDTEDTESPYEVDENGNAVLMADGESSYYKYIQQHRDNAMNVNNYSKTIKEVICIADYDNTNMNAYVAGGVINYYKNYELTKLEVESLTNMSIWIGGRGKWKEKEKCDKADSTRQCRRLHREQILYTSFDTKKNWANNQTIYEHEMYRPFRRPDGSVFYLYERQGFFINPQDSTNEKWEYCADCARDDELNG